MGLPIVGELVESSVQGRSEDGDCRFVRSTSLASEMSEVVDDHVFECWHAFLPFPSEIDMGAAPAAAAIDRDSLASMWPDALTPALEVGYRTVKSPLRCRRWE